MLKGVPSNVAQIDAQKDEEKYNRYIMPQKSSIHP